MTKTKPRKLFVYGTLRKGESRSPYLQRCRLLKVMKVPGVLYRTSFGYPAAVFNENSPSTVQGELYRLPEDSENFMAEIDRVEGTDEGLFSRSVVRFGKESFYFYEPGSRLVGNIRGENTIKSGNWLSDGGLCGKDPFSFAVNFEDIHKMYYRMSPEGQSEENVFLEGSVPVLVTCPHSTAHTRMGKLKRHEFYTAALGASLHSVLKCHCLYSNREQSKDPNYYDDCHFKAVLEGILSQTNIEMVVDIHGTGNERPQDLFPGAGVERELLLTVPQVLDMFYSTAEKYKIPTGSSDIFSAARQNTVSKFVAKRFSVPAIQIEISDRLRMPRRREGEFRNLVGFLLEFVGKMVSKKTKKMNL